MPNNHLSDRCDEVLAGLDFEADLNRITIGSNDHPKKSFNDLTSHKKKYRGVAQAGVDDNRLIARLMANATREYKVAISVEIGHVTGPGQSLAVMEGDNKRCC